MLRLLVPFFVCLMVGPAAYAADSDAIREVRAAWTACTDYLKTQPDNWIGWRRDLGGGYGDVFEFWENDDGDLPSVLKRVEYIDAIVSKAQTYCFRRDRSLAFVYYEMTSPNVATDPDEDFVFQQGRIYIGPTGQVLSVLEKVVDQDEMELAEGAYAFARGRCEFIDLYLKVDRARAHYESEIGTLDDAKPAYTQNLYDWCSAAER